MAVEILPRGDRRLDIADEIAVYLAAGTLLLIVLDPVRRTVALHDSDGVTLLREHDVLKHRALPEFALDLARLFAALNFPPTRRRPRFEPT